MIDPVETRTADVTDRHARPDPAATWRWRAVLARMVERGEVDESFVAAADVDVANESRFVGDDSESATASSSD